MPKFDTIQASLKAAAVGGIFMVWANLTIQVFKFSWHIITTSPGTYKTYYKNVCQKCGEIYDDDKEMHVISGALLCEDCR